MPERDVGTTVDMHPLSTLTPTFTFRQVKISLKTVNRSSGCGFSNDGFRVMEPEQTGRDMEKIRGLLKNQLPVFLSSDIIHGEGLLLIGMYIRPRCNPILQEDPPCFQLFSSYGSTEQQSLRS